MRLEHIKMTIAAVWVLTALFFTIVIQPSTRGAVVLACLGLLPPLVLLLLWNDPPQTLSESINEARR